MTRTTKSERKWGKKPEDKGKNKSNIKTEDQYKILIEGCAFSKAMSYEDCQIEIERYEREAIRLKQPVPSLVLVKQ